MKLKYLIITIAVLFSFASSALAASKAKIDRQVLTAIEEFRDGRWW